MAEIAIEDWGAGLDTLVRRAEGGEAIVVTRDGRPVVEITARTASQGRGVDLAAAAASLRRQGYPEPFPYIAEDFDAPLPEDFLLHPLP